MVFQDEGVVREDQPFTTQFDDRGIVAKPPRGGITGQRGQRGDEIRFFQRPASFATASSTPFTNFASRSSKKALVTSGRAISS